MTEHRPQHRAADDITVGERLGWLRRNMWTWGLALVLLVVAILVGVSVTFGVFSASSPNPHNVTSAGSMSQVNSADNQAIMSANGLVPGETVDGSVSIKNAGDAAGDFRLTVEDVHDEPGPAGGKLSSWLWLKVFDKRRTVPVYSGRLGRLDVSLGTWATDEERSYRFVVSVPSSTGGTDDQYQRSKVTATFEWHASQVH